MVVIVLRLLVVSVLLLCVVATACGVARSEPSYDPFATTQGALHIDPRSEAARWVASNPDDPRADDVHSAIATRPVADWFGGPVGKVRRAVDEYVSSAARQHTLPVLVAYNIPSRACGTYDTDGGAADGAEYRAWIREFAAGIGTRPAVVVLEPDSLLLLDGCLDAAGQQERLALLRDAGGVLSVQAPGALVYMDGSDGRFTSPETMASRLRDAGVAQTRGFAVNVSNYNRTGDAAAYAGDLARLLGPDSGPARAVIDVGRNGNGPGNGWCNPAGRALGEPPRVGGPEGVDALLWIKPPGETDGDCGIGSGYGDSGFRPELAEALLSAR